MNISELANEKPKKFHLDLDREVTHFDQCESVDSEIKELQDQIDSLEIHTKKKKKINKRSDSIDSFLQGIDKTEREIKRLENRIEKFPVKRPQLDNAPQLLGELKAKVVLERRNNYLIKKENESLRKKIIFKVDVAEEFESLREDYKTLIDSFKRSENIRKKQKKLIFGLKDQLGTRWQSPKKNIKSKIL